MDLIPYTCSGYTRSGDPRQSTDGILDFVAVEVGTADDQHLFRPTREKEFALVLRAREQESKRPIEQVSK